MKKLICLLLTAILLMSVMVFSATAGIVPTGYGYEDYSEPTEVALRVSTVHNNPTGTTEPESIYELQYNEGDTTVQVCGFKNYTGLVDLVIPLEYNGKPITRIAESAFKNNSDIISVTLPESITYIDRTAFGNCSNLETINYNCTNARNYNTGYIYTDNYVFEGCNTVKEINIGNNVESIPDYAFAGIDIDSISNFIIPENVKKIGQKIFNNKVIINTLEYNAIECEVGVIDYWNHGEATEMHYYKAFPKINTVIVGKNVNVIPSDNYKEPFAETNLSTVLFKDGIKNVSGFRDCDQITEIIIPNGVMDISEAAFLNCSKLETVIIPKSVSKVGKNAFYNTAWLNNQTSDAVYINNTLYQYNNSEETEAIVREGTTTILDYAFGGMDNLTSVTLPDSVTSIGSYAFSNCTSLQSVHLGKGITIIPEYCFNGCTNLEDINIGKSIEFVGDYAFAGSGLSNVFISDNVAYLGSFAFGGCSNLKEVKIGKGIEIINCGTFIGCINLEKVTLSDHVKQILGYSTHGSYWDTKDFGAFENCSNLTSIDIPNGVEVIGSYVFRGCSNLKNVTLPATLDSIGSEAFYNCTSLSSISIPKSVKTIGNHAFWNCPKLKDIYFYNPDCQIYNNYETISGSAAIHGYDGSTAQTYAGNYNRSFVLIEDTPTVLGDVDGDGIVSVIDATTIQKKLANLTIVAFDEKGADTDGDGTVSVIDATCIQKYLASLPCPEGIGKPK